MTRRSVSRRALRAARLPVFAVAAALSAVTVLAAESDSGESIISARVKEIFDFNRNGVVKIQSTDSHGHIEGTGFYADSSGTIYTGLDVIGDGSNITVIQGMRKLPARLEIADPRTGIAIIKVDTTTPFLPLGDSSKTDAYTPLVTIGYPYDKPAVWSSGLVAGLEKEYLSRYFHTTHIRAKLPVQPGFGGAPVLNLRGEVIGIVVAGVDENNGCFILPINAAEKVRTDFDRFHQLRPGWVGISVEPASDNSLPSTARITELQPDAPATRAGVQKGDLLLRVGDIAIHAPEDIFDASFFLTAGDETTVTVLRDGTEQKFTVRAAENPSSPTVTDESDQPEHSILTLETSSTMPPAGR
jgi:serine protease Do